MLIYTIESDLAVVGELYVFSLKKNANVYDSICMIDCDRRIVSDCGRFCVNDLVATMDYL